MKRTLILVNVLSLTLPVIGQDLEVTKVIVNEVELHYTEQGHGEPVILLHGGQGDYRSWQPQLATISRKYRTISYSRRYHHPNDNALTSTNHSALIDAEDLAALLNELEVDKAHLVGTSYGAFTALAFALNHPESVKSMVLAEPPVLQWATDTAKGVALYDAFLSGALHPAREAFHRGDVEGAMRFFIDTFDGKGAFDALPTERRASVMSNSRFFQAIALSDNPFPKLSKEAVGQLPMPVLVIVGEHTDQLHKLVCDELYRLLSSPDWVTIPNAGHGSPRQNPDAFTAAVLDFIGQWTDE